MGTRQRKRIWAAAKVERLVKLAVRSGNRALLIEVDEDAEVVRIVAREATAHGWVTVSEQTTDTLCTLEVVDGLPLLDDDVDPADHRPGLARCGFGPSSLDSDSEAA